MVNVNQFLAYSNQMLAAAARSQSMSGIDFRASYPDPWRLLMNCHQFQLFALHWVFPSYIPSDGVLMLFWCAAVRRGAWHRDPRICMGKSKKISPSPRSRADGRTLAKFEALLGVRRKRPYVVSRLRPCCNVWPVALAAVAISTRWVVRGRRPMALTSPSPSRAERGITKFI